MKILLFEFITGGGFADQVLPESLAREGAMMLQALVTDLKSLADVELIVLLDWRCKIQTLPESALVVQIGQGQDYQPILKALMRKCDLFWPVAPETGGLLTGLADLASSEGITALLSSRTALELCASKFATCKHLRQYAIDAVDTQYLDLDAFNVNGAVVLKPDDGVGCEGGLIVSSAQEYQRLRVRLVTAGAYVVQPRLEGRTMSLSCIFRDGRAWLLCRNEQNIVVENGRFRLAACRVNVQDNRSFDYQALVTQVAEAIPGLWGYIGIDLIETEQHGPVILEINPRLTTSYVGIQAATGINVAELTLCLLTEEPVLSGASNRTIDVNIETGNH